MSYNARYNTFLKVRAGLVSVDDRILCAAHRDPDIRWAIASSSKTPSEVLVGLAKDENNAVRMEVARNPNTPPAVKLWLKNGYGEMTLEEFLRAVDSKG